jgi:HK97 family phage major capsid protein
MRSELAFLYYNLTKTMRTLKQVIEERAAKLDRIAALSDITTAEKRNWSEAETSEFATLETEVRALNTEKATLEAQERAALHVAARAAGAPVQGKFSEKEERDLSAYSLRKGLVSLAERNSPLSGIELEMHQEAQSEARSSGIATSGGLMIPQMVLDRMYAKRAPLDPSNGNGANLYGEVSLGYVEALRPNSVALQLGAEYMSGMTNSFKIPRENAVYSPSFRATQAAAVESTPSFEPAAFAPKRATGYMDVDRQLLVQTANAIEARLRNQLVLGHAQLLDRVAFSGAAASNEPVGILNDTDVPVLAIGTNGGAITKALVETLVQRLEEANGMNDNSRWVVSPILKRMLKALVVDAGSGQFVWDRMTNSIDGIAAIATTHVPKNLTKGTGTNLTAAILGDFRSATYAQWGGTEIIVDTVTQALAGNIRYVPIQYVDFHVTQPGHFQVIKDITTS